MGEDRPVAFLPGLGAHSAAERDGPVVPELRGGSVGGVTAGVAGLTASLWLGVRAGHLTGLCATPRRRATI